MKKGTNMEKGSSALLLGIAAAMVVLLAGIGTLAFLAQKETIGVETGMSLTYVVLGISALVGTIIGTATINEKVLLKGSLVVGVYLLFLLCVTALVFKGSYRGIIPGVISVAVGGYAGILLKIPRKGRSPWKLAKKSYR